MLEADMGCALVDLQSYVYDISAKESEKKGHTAPTRRHLAG